MTTKIYCRTTGAGVQSFYLVHRGEEHFLFSQDYRVSVRDYYGRGVMVDRALNNPRAGENAALRKTMEKLPAYIRYVEKEYGITVLEQTRRREDRKHHHKHARAHEWDIASTDDVA